MSYTYSYCMHGSRIVSLERAAYHTCCSVLLVFFVLFIVAAAQHSTIFPATTTFNMQQQHQEQQKQQQQFPSWPPATWLEDALGFREKKNGSYRHNQKVLFDMQQQRAQQTPPGTTIPTPHSFAIGTSRSRNNKKNAAVDDLVQKHDDDDDDDDIVQYGEFSCPSVHQLREECHMLTQQLLHDAQQRQKEDGGGAATASAIVWHMLPHTNVLHLYAAPDAAGCDDATFQAASQFNCLEMTSPNVTPEAGIAGYVNDRTQGPASAMACAAGTAFRNYLVNVDAVMNNDTNEACSSSNDITHLGQTKNHQINTLADILTQLEQRVVVVTGHDNLPQPLIRVRNGYAEATEASLRATHAVLLNNNNYEDEWIRLGRVGIQHETQVTFPPPPSSTAAAATVGSKKRRLVTQVYCSAVPIAYSYDASAAAWEPLAKIVLKSCYEATLLVAVRNVARAMLSFEQEQRRRKNTTTTTTTCTANQPAISNNNKDDGADDESEYDYYRAKIERSRRVYLTKVGGGVFGNDEAWILDAMRHAHHRVSKYGIHLNVFIVNFGENSGHDERLVQELNDPTRQQQQQQNHRPQQQQQEVKNGYEDNKGGNCTVH